MWIFLQYLVSSDNDNEGLSYEIRVYVFVYDIY